MTHCKYAKTIIIKMSYAINIVNVLSLTDQSSDILKHRLTGKMKYVLTIHQDAKSYTE